MLGYKKWFSILRAKINKKERKKEYLPLELKKYFLISKSRHKISVIKTLFCHMEKAKFP